MLAICLGVSVTQGLLLLCASSVTMGGLQGAERLVRSVQRVGWTQLLKPWRQHSTTLEAFRDLNIGIGIGLGMFSPIAATRPFRSGIHFIAVRLNFLHLEDLVLQSLLTANLYGILCHFADLDIGQMIGSGISDKRRTTMRPTPVTDLPNDIFTVLPHALAFLPGSDFLWIFIFFSSIFLRGLLLYFFYFYTTLHWPMNKILSNKMFIGVSATFYYLSHSTKCSTGSNFQ
nr:unnamed protein product [Callosobruchus analis]